MYEYTDMLKIKKNALAYNTHIYYILFANFLLVFSISLKKDTSQCPLIWFHYSLMGSKWHFKKY